MSNNRLGKGLDALLNETAEKDNLELNSIPIHEIVPNPNQPRDQFDSDQLDELTQSIKQQGVVEPILVRPHDDEDHNYMIIAGERRWRAARQAELENIPGIVRDLDPGYAYLLSLVENIQRENLGPLEEAQAYKNLQDKNNMNQEEVANAVGKSRSSVANRLRLLNLPDSVKKALKNGSISAGHARALLGMKNKSRVDDILQKILEDSLNVRETELLVEENKNNHKQSNDPKPSNKEQRSETRTRAFQELEAELEEHVGAPVKIDSQDRKSGKIIIEFNNPEDFERLRENFEKL